MKSPGSEGEDREDRAKDAQKREDGDDHGLPCLDQGHRGPGEGDAEADGEGQAVQVPGVGHYRREQGPGRARGQPLLLGRGHRRLRLVLLHR